LELEKEAALQKCIVELIKAGVVESAHDVSEGGLAVTLAESGFRNALGVRVELSSEDQNSVDMPAEYLLFGEDASRIVLSCDQSHVSGIKQVAARHGISANLIGHTIPDLFEISISGRTVVSAKIDDLRKEWDTALERDLHVDTEERLVPEVLQKS